MPMVSLIKKTCAFALLMSLFFCVFLMFVKIMAYQNAIKYDSMWSNGRKCELVIYIPDYRPYGGIGRVLRMFSNQSFFIVYDTNGKKLKSSAWYFWKAQFSNLVSPEWHGKYALYPTSDGWDGWRLPECN
ncbi:exported protein [Erwinia amylovora Ea644]|uniref:hypothetical protein n=1 Tax=Erwinia amylovora TaxID=552 RepID=UPI0002CA7C3B|nr:hypothetical protein [Erwinia amylovora]CCP04499.1 exported protein [Erwinia amylovora Ea644]